MKYVVTKLSTAIALLALALLAFLCALKFSLAGTKRPRGRGLRRGRSALVLVAGVSALAGCAPWAPPHEGEKIYRNVPFASPRGHDLKMDLYVPQAARPALPVKNIPRFALDPSRS